MRFPREHTSVLRGCGFYSSSSWLPFACIMVTTSEVTSLAERTVDDMDYPVTRNAIRAFNSVRPRGARSIEPMLDADDMVTRNARRAFNSVRPKGSRTTSFVMHNTVYVVKNGIVTRRARSIAAARKKQLAALTTDMAYTYGTHGISQARKMETNVKSVADYMADASLISKITAARRAADRGIKKANAAWALHKFKTPQGNHRTVRVPPALLWHFAETKGLAYITDMIGLTKIPAGDVDAREAGFEMIGFALTKLTNGLVRSMPRSEAATRELVEHIAQRKGMMYVSKFIGITMVPQNEKMYLQCVEQMKAKATEYFAGATNGLINRLPSNAKEAKLVIEKILAEKGVARVSTL